MDRYDLALLTLLRTLLSRRGSAVLADRTGLPGAVAEILAEKTDDDIRAYSSPPTASRRARQTA